MRLNPYLTFNGQCEAAFKFYEKCLGGKILMMMTYGDSPMAGQTPPDWQKKILHTTLTVGNQVLQGADLTPDRFQKPQGFRVTLNIAATAEAERVFKALAEEGAIEMPIQETFWAQRFGVLTDQFGTPWIINGGEPA
ncbi:MAG TPA: VOC family protein [Candidatus Angelobacter sp.]|nr:VOC family protein [Candidatus Angelobacter sp.]